MSCGCYFSLPLPHMDVGWSAVCDCGISWSCSTFFLKILNKVTLKKKHFTYFIYLICYLASKICLIIIYLMWWRLIQFYPKIWYFTSTIRLIFTRCGDDSLSVLFYNILILTQQSIWYLQDMSGQLTQCFILQYFDLNSTIYLVFTRHVGFVGTTHSVFYDVILHYPILSQQCVRHLLVVLTTHSVGQSVL